MDPKAELEAVKGKRASRLKIVLENPDGTEKELNLDAMKAEENSETPEDEKNESPMKQKMEEELGIEKHPKNKDVAPPVTPGKDTKSPDPVSGKPLEDYESIEYNDADIPDEDMGAAKEVFDPRQAAHAAKNGPKNIMDRMQIALGKKLK